MVDCADDAFLDTRMSLVLVSVYVCGRRIGGLLGFVILFVNNICFNEYIFKIDIRSRST